MSSHNVIVVSSDPKGHFIEGHAYAGEIFYPGMVVTIKQGAPLIDGRPQYEKANLAASGERTNIVIVRENDLVGKTIHDAYPAGSRFFGYIPANGDEVQVLVGDTPGTGDEINLGDKLIIEDGTGCVIKTTGSPESEPFEALETLGVITADKLCLCRVTGV